MYGNNVCCIGITSTFPLVLFFRKRPVSHVETHSDNCILEEFSVIQRLDQVATHVEGINVIDLVSIF